ncbi:super-infection exclusion protein B [Rubinisphaera italica]|uniref:Superinfection exclusion protein B n=1 Tax=Rubinisphaera italica TaxID=2527969 RepID=A0A5C5XNG2_9PLAN|nr:super-infection exclusion protein B [Rubinisphaera italica]TWT64258.1 hypothetical protein Pan54_50190 [Rubinisphaera italica]
MPDWVELAKLAVRPRYSFSLFFTSLVVLLVPLPSQLKIEEIRDEYGKWIGLAAVFFFIVWVIELFILGASFIAYIYDLYKEKELMKSMLDGLNQDEKLILMQHVNKNETTLNWPANKPGIASLVHKGVLEQVSSDSTFGKPYVVDNRVWVFIRNKPDRYLRSSEIQA